MVKSWRAGLLFLVGMLVLAGAAGAVPGLSARLAEDKAWVGESEDLAVRLTLANDGAATVRLPRWLTPFHGVEADLFDVRLNGEPVAYLGRLVKRAAPRAEDYLEILPGQSLAGMVELSAIYDMRRPGEYTVAYRAFLGAPIDLTLGRGQEPALTRSNEVAVWREGDAGLFDAIELLAADEPGPDSRPGLHYRYVNPSFVACSSSRQTTLRSALGQAQTYASNSSSYLQAGTRGPRYTTWFGTYSSSRYNKARSNFSSILSRITNNTFTFHCDCTDNYYAYVYPNQPYHVWLCNAFWSAPLSGTDSKAGTLIHETSHFNAVAGTDDWAYGQSACRSLATSNPNRAVDNADSHEYFAENTPAQN